MRIFRYWVQYAHDIVLDGVVQPSKIYGGSNVSEADALEDAKKRLEEVQKRIASNNRDWDYGVDIREEMIAEIDSDNIITRNRYGALVLNSKHLMFIDIDQQQKHFWESFFRPKLTPKELSLRMIKKRMSQFKYRKYGFRLYETSNGYRLMVTGRDFEPDSNETRDMMRDFKGDWVYIFLCKRQKCFRARLTPKPYRIRQKGLKVIFPNRTAEENQIHNNWVESYNARSEKYATCKLVLTHGNQQVDKVVEYHDRLCRVDKELRLA